MLIKYIISLKKEKKTHFKHGYIENENLECCDRDNNLSSKESYQEIIDNE